MNNPLKIYLVFAGIALSVVLNSCDNVQDQSNFRNLSIVPLEKPVFSGQPVLFQVQEKGVKESPIYWNFGDNTITNGSSVNHVFTKPGIYYVTLFTEEEDGAVEHSAAIVRVHTPETSHLPQSWTQMPAMKRMTSIISLMPYTVALMF